MAKSELTWTSTRRGFLRTSALAAVAAALSAGARGADTDTQAIPNPTDLLLPATPLSGNLRLPRLDIAPGQVVEFDPNASTTVEVAGNAIVRGILRMRPARADVVHTLRFVDVDEAAFMGGGNVPLESDVGLWVVEDGVLDAVGQHKTPWLRAAGGLSAGETTFQLSGVPTAWQRGDELTVTPTLPPSTSRHDSAYDYPQIVTQDQRALTLDRPLTFDHPLVNGLWAAEVLQLTRNVRIEGTPRGRAHIFFGGNVPQTLRNVAIRHMGPRQRNRSGGTGSVKGRYPLHFHMMGDASRGSLVENVVARDCGAHAFVAHTSHGVAFKGCIGHATMEDVFWWDNKELTHDVVWENCVASRALVGERDDGRQTLTGFFLGRGTGNRCVGCVGVGVQGEKNASGMSWPSQANEPPNVWTFHDAVCHNNREHGIFNWQNKGALHLVERFSAYHNGDAGVAHGAYRNTFHFLNGMLYGNGGDGVTVHTTSKAHPNRLTFEDIAISAPDAAVRFARHNPKAPFEAPVLFIGCALGAPRPVLVDHGGARNTIGTQGDFVDCGITGDDVHLADAPVGTVIRVQQGTEAWKVTVAGVEPIGPFYP